MAEMNFYKIYNWMDDLKLKPTEKMAYSLIYAFYENNQVYRGSYKYLQKKLCISKPTALTVLRNLVNKGLLIKKLQVDELGNHPTIYAINEASKNALLQGGENCDDLSGQDNSLPLVKESSKPGQDNSLPPVKESSKAGQDNSLPPVKESSKAGQDNSLPLVKEFSKTGQETLPEVGKNSSKSSQEILPNKTIYNTKYNNTNNQNIINQEGEDDNLTELCNLYQENIGKLLPLEIKFITEDLQRFPKQWIKEAIILAVQNGARHYKYIRTILENWQRSGKYDHQQNVAGAIRLYKRNPNIETYEEGRRKWANIDPNARF